MREQEYDNEYDFFILTIKIFSDSWISSSEIYETTSSQEIIEKYCSLFVKLFFPYLTAKGKNEFLNFWFFVETIISIHLYFSVSLSLIRLL